MELLEEVFNYNKSDMELNTLLRNIFCCLEKEISPACIYWFCKDIKDKENNLKPLTITKQNNVLKICSQKKELFKIERKKYNNLDVSDSLLRTSLYDFDRGDGTYFEIYNDKYILGRNGLYEKNTFNPEKYKYITFNEKNNIYYEAIVDKRLGTIKKYFYGKDGEVESCFYYTFKEKNNNNLNKYDADNKINKILDEEFDYLYSREKMRTFCDLVDQYYYDIVLTDKKEEYKDLYITNKSSMVIEDLDNDILYGLAFKQKNSRNKEEFLALTNSSNKDIKLLCITDFVNGSKVDKAFSKYVTLEMKSWFNNLKALELTDEEKLLYSLKEKLLYINNFITKEIRKVSKKENEKKVIGSSIGLALITKDNTFIINYGDTRAYALKDDDLFALTIDDTKVWDLYKANRYSRDEAIMYQRGSLLTNYLGNVDTYYKVPDIFKLDNASYDHLYLFSDGVTDNMKESTLFTIINSNHKSEILREITTSAYRNQGRCDDITGCCYIKKK